MRNAPHFPKKAPKKTDTLVYYIAFRLTRIQRENQAKDREDDGAEGAGQIQAPERMDAGQLGDQEFKYSEYNYELLNCHMAVGDVQLIYSLHQSQTEVMSQQSATTLRAVHCCTLHEPAQWKVCAFKRTNTLALCPATIWMVMLLPMDATCWKNNVAANPNLPAQRGKVAFTPYVRLQVRGNVAMPRDRKCDNNNATAHKLICTVKTNRPNTI